MLPVHPDAPSLLRQYSFCRSVSSSAIPESSITLIIIMDNSTHQSGANPVGLNRRDAMKMLGVGSAAGLFGMLGVNSASAAPRSAAASGGTPSYAVGMPPVKIRSVKAIGTAP